MAENKPSYATFIENIKFFERIQNPTGTTVGFGILGVQTTGPQPVPFKTSWDGAGVPGGRLELWAGCWGPQGIPCNGNADTAWHEDHVGDNPLESSPHEIQIPGNYQLRLFVCYSAFADCLQPGGVWAELAGPVPFTAVHWTPTPTLAGAGDAEPDEVVPSDDGRPVCYLVTDDPGGIYLNCQRAKMRMRAR
jgi:hypothetical protein